MSLAGLLTHRLAIVAPVNEEPADEDEWGQPVRGAPATTLVNGLVQPRSARELAHSSAGGAPVSDHVVYLLPQELDASAYIRDEPDTGRRFNIVGIRHLSYGTQPHLEVDVLLVGPTVGPPIA